MHVWDLGNLEIVLMVLEAGRVELAAGMKELHDSDTLREK